MRSYNMNMIHDRTVSTQSFVNSRVLYSVCFLLYRSLYPRAMNLRPIPEMKGGGEYVVFGGGCLYEVMLLS